MASTSLITTNSKLDRYLQHYLDRKESLTKECSFSPSLDKTRNYNKRSPSVSQVDTESTFDRNMDWLERRDRSLDLQRIENISKVEKTLTFKPKTNHVATEKSITPEKKIFNHDTIESREQFKKIHGVDKFLGRSYKAMCNREELKLMQHNLGKLPDHQLTLDEVVKPTFAYQDIAPSFDVHRVSLMNSGLDGSKKQKDQSRAKKLTAGVDYKNIKKFLSRTIRNDL